MVVEAVLLVVNVTFVGLMSGLILFHAHREKKRLKKTQCAVDSALFSEGS
jgi:hypothetical protein